MVTADCDFLAWFDVAVSFDADGQAAAREHDEGAALRQYIVL